MRRRVSRSPWEKTAYRPATGQLATPIWPQITLFAFTGASLVSGLGVVMGWGAYHGGWPEPSEIGLI